MKAQSSFFIATLGCKVNQYESHALREAWTTLGGQEAGAPEQADVILINSCAVTARAVSDVRAEARRLHRAAPDVPIFITGCAAEVQGRELAALPGVAGVLPQTGKAALMRLFPEQYRPDDAQADAARPYPPFALSGYDRSRAVLKVQDGCSHGCTYCIVPLARGRAVSRPVADAVDEARRLLAAGFREIVVSGVNLRQFKGDSGEDFWDLLTALDAAFAPQWADGPVPAARFRVSSLEPGQLGARALDVLGACRMVAPHLHLSLQSGSPSVLRRMGRGHYNPEDVNDFLRRLRDIWPVFGLGADILIGFPGESEAEFEEGLSLIDCLPLTYAHVFPYSRRPGTRAADMPGQVPQAVKKRRSAVLRALVGEKNDRFLHLLLRQTPQYAVFEKRGEGTRRGVNEFYVDCRLDEQAAILPEDGGYGLLTAVQPMRVEKGCLVVAPAPNAGAAP